MPVQISVQGELIFETATNLLNRLLAKLGLGSAPPPSLRLPEPGKT
jgi:hypothetical protein